jgi:hypothetical protein
VQVRVLAAAEAARPSRGGSIYGQSSLQKEGEGKKTAAADGGGGEEEEEGGGRRGTGGRLKMTPKP